MSDLPPFSLTSTRYDMTTFSGRVKYFFCAIDPRNAVLSSSAIRQALEDVENFKQGDRSLSDARLWQSRAIKEACTHPSTCEPIFPLFRMSAFCPVNFAIVPFTLLPSTIASPVRTIGIHWTNQSYNCAVNYANRSSDAMPLSELMPAYVGAVGVSVGLGLGATALLRKLPTGSTAATMVRAVLPFAAVSASGTANVAITRSKEWTSSGEGVDIKDPSTGEVVAKSTAAGWRGLQLCAAARVIWNVPCMMIPVLLSARLQRSFAHVLTTPGRKIALECLLCNMGTAFGVPPALAVFPPDVRMKVEFLEEPVRRKLLEERPDLTEIEFYKGL